MATTPAGKAARKRSTNIVLPSTATWAEAWDEVKKRLDASAPEPVSERGGFATFELSFEQALARQLAPFFESLEALELNPENLRSEVPAAARGAYYLVLGGEVVYIGKSDAKTGLQTRLLRHYKTLRRRKNIAWQEMKFKAVKVASLAALDTESLLLDMYKLVDKARGGKGRPTKWNNSGFGSNDTGAERDTQKVSYFDQQFPLNLDAVIEVDANNPAPVGMVTLDRYLDWLRETLGVTFRLPQKKKVPAASRLETVQVDVSVMTASMRFRDLLEQIHHHLPSDWTLVVLRGKLILNFRESRPYKSPLWTLTAGVAPVEPSYEMNPEDAEDEDAEPAEDGNGAPDQGAE